MTELALPGRGPARLTWLAAAAALLLLLLALLLQPARLPFSWLAAFTLFSLFPLGSIALLFIHALTGGRWGDAVRPGLLLGASLAPLLLPLVIPVLLTLPVLYAWARPEGAALPNRFWLNPGFFALRGAVELATWLGLSVLATRNPARRLARWAPFALPLLALTVTAGAIDLTMSLDPRFTSSSYGMVAGAGAVTFALALAIRLSPPPPPDVSDDLGRLLLALCAFWSYLDFMQVLIVWQSDLVAQTPWYLARTAGLWGWTMAAAALLHGPLPILLLLLPSTRRSPARLRATAALVLVAELLRAWWTVLPPHGFSVGDLACTALVGLLALLFARWRQAHA